MKDLEKPEEEEEDDDEEINVDSSISTVLTKNGTPRKRRPPLSKAEKAELFEKKRHAKFEMIVEKGLGACEVNCGYRCSENIPYERRLEILKEYFWLSTTESKKIFVLNLCERLNVKEGPKRKIKNRFIYRLLANKDSKAKIRVCKRFFISTLGYSSTSVGLFYSLLAHTPNNGIPFPSKRGKCGNGPANKFLHRNLVVEHINSYDPKYKGRKGPNLRRYLPKTLSAKSLHDDFCRLHPSLTISYRSFCVIVKQENVVFDK